MQKKKSLKLIVIFLISLFIFGAFTNFIFAGSQDGFKAAGFEAKKKTTSTNFDTQGKEGTNFSTLTEKSAKTAISIMRIAGITIAVVMLLVIAMKYMVSSAGDRADIKKHAIVYVVGAMVLFGAVGILGIIEDLTTKSLGS